MFAATLRVSILCLTASMVASVELRGRRKQGMHSGTAMHPQVVAEALRKVEDEWFQYATVRVECDGTDDDCAGDFKAFESSCDDVVMSIIHGSSGDSSVVREYMSDVCGESVLPADWHHDRCRSLSDTLISSMSVDPASNREHFDSKATCTGLWTQLQGDAKAQAELYLAAREAAEKEQAAEAAAEAQAAEEQARLEKEEAEKVAEAKVAEERARLVTEGSEKEHAERVAAEAEAQVEAQAEKERAASEAEKEREASEKEREASEAEKEHQATDAQAEVASTDAVAGDTNVFVANDTKAVAAVAADLPVTSAVAAKPIPAVEETKAVSVAAVSAAVPVTSAPAAEMPPVVSTSAASPAAPSSAIQEPRGPHAH